MGKKRQEYNKIVEKERQVETLIKDYLDYKQAEGVGKFTIDIQEDIINRYFADVANFRTDSRKERRDIHTSLVTPMLSRYLLSWNFIQL